MVEVQPISRRFTMKLSTGLIIAAGICLSCGRGESDSKSGHSKELETSVSSSSKGKSKPEPIPSEVSPDLAVEKSSSTSGEIAPGGVDPKKWLDEVRPVGVAVCDRFLVSYRRCINDHGPSSGVNEHIEKLREQVEAWRTMIAGKPKSAKIIEVGCQAAKASAQHATSAWGCDWK